MIVQAISIMPRGKARFSGQPSFAKPSMTGAGLANFITALMVRPSTGSALKTYPVQSMALDGGADEVVDCMIGSFRILSYRRDRRGEFYGCVSSAIPCALCGE